VQQRQMIEKLIKKCLIFQSVFVRSWRHDIQHNDTKQIDIQRYGFNCDTRHE